MIPIRKGLLSPDILSSNFNEIVLQDKSKFLYEKKYRNFTSYSTILLLQITYPLIGLLRCSHLLDT